MSPIIDAKVKVAIFSMDAYKAPGNDSFQSIFYQDNWDVIRPSMCHFIKNAFKDCGFEKNMNDTLFCIIPKVDNPNKPSQLRLISLYNVVVKAITKIMVNQIRPFLDEVINLTQSSFIQGRGCHDNIIIIQEALHSLKKCKGLVDNFILKVDLEKAYDHIDWHFLKQVLHDAGFLDYQISLVLICILESRISLLWNKEKTKSFYPYRGLRQGDPSITIFVCLFVFFLIDCYKYH